MQDTSTEQSTGSQDKSANEPDESKKQNEAPKFHPEDVSIIIAVRLIMARAVEKYKELDQKSDTQILTNKEEIALMLLAGIRELPSNGVEVRGVSGNKWTTGMRVDKEIFDGNMRAVSELLSSLYISNTETGGTIIHTEGKDDGTSFQVKNIVSRTESSVGCRVEADGNEVKIFYVPLAQFVQALVKVSGMGGQTASATPEADNTEGKLFDPNELGLIRGAFASDGPQINVEEYKEIFKRYGPVTNRLIADRMLEMIQRINQTLALQISSENDDSRKKSLINGAINDNTTSLSLKNLLRMLDVALSEKSDEVAETETILTGLGLSNKSIAELNGLLQSGNISEEDKVALESMKDDITQVLGIVNSTEIGFGTEDDERLAQSLRQALLSPDSDDENVIKDKINKLFETLQLKESDKAKYDKLISWLQYGGLMAAQIVFFYLLKQAEKQTPREQ
jgi:hypothetical protein